MQEIPEVRIQKTGDGSDTLYHEQLNETYHSSHGALAESIHVFISQGLGQLEGSPPIVRVLEVGLGTGLNAVLSFQWAKAKGKSLHYTSLEPFPLALPMIEQLNYATLLAGSGGEWLARLHEADWDKAIALDSHIVLEKLRMKIEGFTPAHYQQPYDIVFYDAFAPRKQPELWTVEALQPAVEALKPGGILVTYCAMGQFRRNLKALGMQAEKIPGPPGKREMTRALKPMC